MEVKKIDIWMLIFILLMYIIVNIFRTIPVTSIAENTVMLGVLFALLVVGYFLGTVVALGSSAVVLFFYGSYVLYRNFVLGYEVEPYVYFWLVVIPLLPLTLALTGDGVRLLQKDNLKFRKEYSEAVTINVDTGLFNEKVFYSVLSQYMSLSKRHKIPVSILLIKIMYREDITSIVGQNGIANVKENVANQIISQTRVEDCCYILDDGWTFALILFADKSGADVVRRRIKQNVYTTKVKKFNKFIQIKLDLNIGRATYESKFEDAFSMKKAAEEDMEYDV